MFCMNCRYPLRGLAHQECPECGRTFVPGDQRTYFVHEWQRRPLRPLPTMRNPRLLRQREWDRQAGAAGLVRVLLFSAVGLVVMYGLFVWMFGPVEYGPSFHLSPLSAGH